MQDFNIDGWIYSLTFYLTLIYYLTSQINQLNDQHIEKEKAQKADLREN